MRLELNRCSQEVVMRVVSPVFASMLLGCAATAALKSSVLSAGDFGLPEAKRPLVVPSGDQATLAGLVREFGAVTEQTLLIDEFTQQDLEAARIPVEASFEVPPEEVYAFVEGCLLHRSFVLSRVKGGERPVLAVLGWNYRRGPNWYVDWVEVEPADVPKLAGHPALCIQTLLDCPSLDVRAASSTLRGLLREPDSQMLLPVGDHTLFIRGPGAVVADVIEVLRRTEQAESARSRERTAPAPAPEKGG